MSDKAFPAKLAQGKVSESLIARWLVSRGWNVLPVYETSDNAAKGPRLSTPNGEIVAPDMLAMKAGEYRWVEAKDKHAASWYRIGGYFVTGVNLSHYQDYLLIEDSKIIPVWLLFLHRGGTAKDSPPSPAGLFGGALSDLRYCESHRSDKHGSSGMVYWKIESLKRLATIETMFFTEMENSK